MYTPPHFKEDRIEVLHEAIRRTGLGILVSLGPDGLIASHVPMLLDAGRGPNGTLVGHLAKANAQGRHGDPAIPSLAIFQGVEAYITPNWYAAKQEHGKVVPTWNYVAVHAYGPLAFFDDKERLREVVTRLTDHHEAANERPWAVSDAPESFVEAHMKGIVGFELPIERIEGKWKMSQNRPAADKPGIVAGLADRDGADAPITVETRRILAE